jgi:hypothetical protein
MGAVARWVSRGDPESQPGGTESKPQWNRGRSQRRGDAGRGYAEPGSRVGRSGARRSRGAGCGRPEALPPASLVPALSWLWIIPVPGSPHFGGAPRAPGGPKARRIQGPRCGPGGEGAQNGGNKIPPVLKRHKCRPINPNQQNPPKPSKTLQNLSEPFRTLFPFGYDIFRVSPIRNSTDYGDTNEQKRGPALV